ncbi:glycoside hydrolase family 72 protein [Laccaria bicolor S238N-H82]|uniref:1,3-beta-glucanosyltransferase n=1 Tax=Laccaria bicolor (strain S238N-H82 / ATCC MYA-4686) TaxID=486041 RepID=B0DIY2_LACBS|nr:glycoside hydrolase family 72 protein [Laccaria bicolor S238N-H82]EDR05312.1 glycoside hydrolase family 72 protein [Laccaria bicolor S238N-H82]|eukprot:XP_001883870.1 glycoside hydrolase family 72 protein [Laccaria bicolor S238N-H82]
MITFEVESSNTIDHDPKQRSHEVVWGSCPRFPRPRRPLGVQRTRHFTSLSHRSVALYCEVLLQGCVVPTTSVYSIENYDLCLKAFSGTGVYTIINLTLSLNGSIDRSSPAWSTTLLDQYIATIDAFSEYDNVLACHVGNEVINSSSNTNVAPFVKALLETSSTAKKSNFLIGYAAIDGADNFQGSPSNTNSGSTAIDLFNLNNYLVFHLFPILRSPLTRHSEWCGNSTFADSYTDTENNFAGYNVAAYFSEYGSVPPSDARPSSEQAPSCHTTCFPSGWGIAFSYFSSSQRRRSIRHNHLTTRPSRPPRTSLLNTALFLGSTTLPATPNLAACQCLQSALSCPFTPVVSGYTIVAGQLINTACGLLEWNVL